MIFHIDAGTTGKATRLDNGFLRVPARLGKVGVLTYRTGPVGADGKTRRELRLPEDVFRGDSLQTFALAPVTDDHPPVPVTADNARTYMRGTVGEGIRQDGDYIAADLMITDSALIAKIERGEKVQVSCGYHADLEWTAGEWNGQRYDCIQRNIRGNHVALVRAGRAGPDVRVRLDAADAIMVDDDSGLQEPSHTEDTMHKYRIDGVEYEVSESAVQALDKAFKAHADALSTVQTSADKHQARADAAEAKVKELEKLVSPDAMQAAVQARVSLEKRAALLLDSVDSKLSDTDLIKAAVVKAVPTLNLDGRSDEYLKARFDLAVEDAEKAAAAKAKLGSAIKATRQPRTDGIEVVDSEKKRAEFIEQQRKAAQAPLAVSVK